MNAGNPQGSKTHLGLEEKGLVFHGRLQGPAVAVVESIVEQKDLRHLKAQAGQLAAQLFEGVWAEAAGHQAARVFTA